MGSLQFFPINMLSNTMQMSNCCIQKKILQSYNERDSD